KYIIVDLAPCPISPSPSTLSPASTLTNALSLGNSSPLPPPPDYTPARSCPEQGLHHPLQQHHQQHQHQHQLHCYGHFASHQQAHVERSLAAGAIGVQSGDLCAMHGIGGSGIDSGSCNPRPPLPLPSAGCSMQGSTSLGGAGSLLGGDAGAPFSAPAAAVAAAANAGACGNGHAADAAAALGQGCFAWAGAGSGASFTSSTSNSAASMLDLQALGGLAVDHPLRSPHSQSGSVARSS
ncbi:hypothetical protein DUNSADRAFT_1910, partial [Dunaliella salina]